MRMLLVPIFIIAFLQKYFFVTTIIFCLAAITDILDGFLARRLKKITTLGACLDPIADKILVSSSFILLTIYGYLPSCLTVIVIFRDAFILLGGLLFFLFDIPFKICPSFLGKLTTAVQVITTLIVLIHIQKSFPPSLLLFFYTLTFFLTIVSGLQYAYIGYKNIVQYTPSK
ncbi:MAG TPA: CDP-diacylglycerol--glycerol-3-phosphate 3-phosphatidyltransferase [Candidatus Desulfofervidus auxilii]|uniref:CDP-diacylglycerol--glycerol-3-phosphate 3-phosphatidyltransferase n=1 Tax=Desulfofervidus auxilii TaxID=1621989 RepID=A0A7V0IAF0_DESA2|nr:CDP-diacylglycerol--glycerol-3-phosphate 3-phosphatidyltransferase [Candidatus Desulfofervidus auxilii]